MTNIVISQLADNSCSGTTVCGCPIGCANPLVVTLTNFDSLDICLGTPVSGFPLPEENDKQNILVKAEGNELIIRVQWIMKCEACSIVTGTVSGFACGVKTVQDQLLFYLCTWQANSIEDKYSIAVDGIVRSGTIRKIGFSKQGSTPVTYRGNFEFIAGDVVAADEDEPAVT